MAARKRAQLDSGAYSEGFDRLVRRNSISPSGGFDQSSERSDEWGISLWVGWLVEV